MSTTLELNERIRKRTDLKDIVAAYFLKVEEFELPNKNEILQKITELAAVGEEIARRDVQLPQQAGFQSLLHFGLKYGKDELSEIRDLHGKASQLIGELNAAIYPKEPVIEPEKPESKQERKARLLNYYANKIQEIWLEIIGQLDATDEERLQIYMKLFLDREEGLGTNTEFLGLLNNEDITEAAIDQHISKVRQKILDNPLIKEKLPQ